MKNFLYVLPNHPWGVASVVSNLIRYSAHPEIHKKVILTGDGVDAEPCDVDFGNAEVIVETVTNGWCMSKLGYMKRIARHISADSIIISNDGNPEFAMVEMLKMRNPVVAVLHGDYSHYFSGCRRYGYLIDRLISVSSYLRDKAVRQLPPNLNPVFIPFPTPEINCGEKTSSQKLYLSYAGAITKIKGCEYFPELVAGLDNSGICYQFDIFGDGNMLGELKQNLAGNPNVVFHGRRPNSEIFDALRRSRITIHLSKNDGLPVSLVEAMKCGSVPVVFDLPTGIPDIIDDGVNGFRLPQDNIAGIVDKVLLLNSDRCLLNRMSASAVKKSTEMFNPYKQTAKYEEMFLATPYRQGKFSARHYSLSAYLLDHLPISLAYRIRKLKG